MNELYSLSLNRERCNLNSADNRILNIVMFLIFMRTSHGHFFITATKMLRCSVLLFLITLSFTIKAQFLSLIFEVGIQEKSKSKILSSSYE